ncbi:hypothetical protein NIES4074_09870 [Cylindrospermum sp. NIES-4074]|nr:hypothetical protein NIES4074_09870 [Cylindrospermum sp. NIES-4074]
MENLTQPIKYSVPSNMRECFEKFVRRPYDIHPKTDAWQSEVRNQKPDYHRKNILEKGRADFTVPFNGLNPTAKVLLYCYQYMQMHVISSYHIFCKHWDLFNGYVSCKSDTNYHSPSPLFIDFGCGPLSSGLAFAHAIGAENQIAFHYIGIDRAKPMLEKAKDFISYQQFGKECTFDFLESYDALVPLIDKYIHQNPELLIILNFSYFFASKSLDVQELVDIIKNILAKHNTNQVYIVFQNPDTTYTEINNKWHDFRNLLPAIESIISGPLTEIIWYKSTMDGYDKKIILYYDILQIKRHEN